MKVLYIGFPKTGTKTVAAALRILGYKVYDFHENYMYLRKEWTKILTEGGTAEDFRRMYSDVDATMDTPAFMFWQEILEAFPDVKLVVSYRDDESWLDSWNALLEEISKYSNIFGFFTPTMYSFSCYLRLISRVMLGGHQYTWPWQFYSGITNQMAVKRYHLHNIEVQQTAPKTQLLEMDYRKGWEPLCRFLDKPIPNVPFPHKNIKGGVIKEVVQTSPVFARVWKEATLLIAVLVGVMAALIWCWTCS